MPSKSPAQARLMAAVAHGWKPKGKKPPVPVAVAEEFNREDAGGGLLGMAMRKRKAKRGK